MAVEVDLVIILLGSIQFGVSFSSSMFNEIKYHEVFFFNSYLFFFFYELPNKSFTKRINIKHPN